MLLTHFQSTTNCTTSEPVYILQKQFKLLHTRMYVLYSICLMRPDKRVIHLHCYPLTIRHSASYLAILTGHLATQPGRPFCQSSGHYASQRAILSVIIKSIIWPFCQ